ncbi:MAG TPA: cation:proton antiporter [Thiotrichales bacterium]|nr:cation:proton antiporter [Thiotrichales bacterium]
MEIAQADPLVYSIFLIFTGAALMATLALYARQSLLVAYVLLGMLFGPSGLDLVSDPELVKGISGIGIVFLLFLLGLDLPLGKLLHLVGKTTRVTGLSSLLFAGLGFGVGRLFGHDLLGSLLIGLASMFSSTIIGLKLLPTTVLHHKHTGEIIVSILLLQDLIAILILLWLEFLGGESLSTARIVLLASALPGLFLVAWLLERYVLRVLIQRFDTIQEYIFLLAIGWCLGLAELAGVLGLSHEIGAFIAGVALAASPIAMFIAESLKPLRDFFLIIFFFALGAGLDLGVLGSVLWPAAVLAVVLMLVKPPVFAWLLTRAGETAGRSREIGVRLGQISEFSLLIAVLALERGVVEPEVSYLIQVATMFTFMVSSYIVVMRYPTPIAVSDQLRRN